MLQSGGEALCARIWRRRCSTIRCRGWVNSGVPRGNNIAISTPGGGTTTWDPTNKGFYAVLSNGNLTDTCDATCAANATSYTGVRSITNHSAGKYYFELTINTASSGGDVCVGFINGSGTLDNNWAGTGTNGTCSFGNSTSGWYISGASTGTSVAFAQGDTIGLALDATGKLGWIRNVTAAPSTWNAGGTADPAAGLGGISLAAITGPYYATSGLYLHNGNQVTANFGPSYAATAPTGFGNW